MLDLHTAAWFDKCSPVCQLTLTSLFHLQLSLRVCLSLTWAWSFALEDGVLPEEATEAGLLGATSFFRTRDLSSPFSGGE